jgi:cobalt-zinc-cadmium efflux system membrane fusion protein
MNKSAILFASALLVIVIAGCHSHDDHDHKASKAADAGHGHGDGISVTHYTDVSELFVEFPPLVKGDEVSFAAHMTRLSDFKAVAEGRLAVKLTGGGQPEEKAEVGVSNTAGIFRPVFKPQHAGKRRLTFELTAPGLNAVHDLGEVEIYADSGKAKAATAPSDGKEELGIKYTKEQQWKIDFANEPAVEREIRESIGVTATLRPRASGEAHLAAPGAGLLRPGPGGFPEIGNKVIYNQIVAYIVPRLGGETDAAALKLAVERARIEADYATRERERLEGLLAVEAVPAKRVLEARNKERLAQAELRAAEQRAATYQGASGGIPLKSPIAGTIVAVAGAPGAAVTEGLSIVHIADLTRLWLDASIPENAIGRIHKPIGASFRPDGAKETIVLDVGRNARLVAFGGLVDPQTRTVPAIFEFTNSGEALRAGMKFAAQLYTGNVTKSIAVRASAIIDDGGQSVVYVQKEGESFERRVVVLGPRDGDHVAIASGVAAGDRVVTRGAYQVRLAALQPAAAGHGHAH